MVSAGEAAIVEFTCQKFGALYDLLTLGLVAFCVWVMFSNKVGSIKIGGKDAKPIMSKWSWFVISLCGGIATGIVFWSIAEPITHFIEGIPGFASLYPPRASWVPPWPWLPPTCTGAFLSMLITAWPASPSAWPCIT